MRWIVLISIIFFSACSDLSNIERTVVGEWEWSVELEGFSEKGYLELKSDRTHSSAYESVNSTEKMRIVKDYTSMSYWRVYNQQVCLATDWSGGISLDEVVVNHESCRWDVIQEPDGTTVLEFNAWFIRNVKASKKKDD